MTEELRTKIAAAAQKIYDEWEQDEFGEDPELGTGGICQLIADAMADVLHEEDEPKWVSRDCAGDEHVALYATPDDGQTTYLVDIPYSLYEERKGFLEWVKLPGVTFLPGFVVFEKLDFQVEFSEEVEIA